MPDGDIGVCATQTCNDLIALDPGIDAATPPRV